MIFKNVYSRVTMFFYFLVLSLFAIPGIAFADTGIDIFDNGIELILGAGAFMLFVIVLFIGIKKMWEHHLMGLVVIVCVAILILLVTNTDFIIKFAQAVASKLGLTWTGTTS